MQKTIKGIVLSSKGDKTIVVGVDRFKKDSIYKKSFKITKKYYAHDEKNKAQKGDQVIISESTPKSRLKRWNLKEIIKG